MSARKVRHPTAHRRGAEKAQKSGGVLGRFLTLLLCAVFALGTGGEARAYDANQAVSLAATAKALALQVSSPAPYNFYDSFTGTPASVGSRTPDTVSNGHTWTVTGADASFYTAGGGKLQDVGGAAQAYAVMQTTCSGAPQEVGGTFVTNGSAAATPTIASVLNYPTYGFNAMTHPNLSVSGGALTATTSFWDTSSRPGGTNLTSQLPAFSQITPASASVAASAAYNYRVIINGNYVLTRVENAATGAVMSYLTAYDPLVAAVSGPYVFFELGPDGSYWKSAYARCASSTPTQTAGALPGGLDGTPIGQNSQSPFVGAAVIHVGIGQPEGAWSVHTGTNTADGPVISSDTTTTLTIKSTASGFTSNLVLQNGAGGQGKIQMDGGYALNLFDNQGNKEISLGANGAGVTFIAPIKFAGTNTTGSGSAALGSNSPATTNTAPYTWIKATAADGSTVYIPAWK